MDAGVMFGGSPHEICWLDWMAPVLWSITWRWQFDPCREIWIVPVGCVSVASLSRTAKDIATAQAMRAPQITTFSMCWRARLVTIPPN
jgi:hypothetical protein